MNKIICALGVMMLCSCSGGYRAIVLDAGAEPDSLTVKACGIFRRSVTERAGMDLFASSGKTLYIGLENEAGDLPDEGFEIVRDGNKVTVRASGSKGMLYGLGLILHRSELVGGRFIPGRIEGRSVPSKPVRGIYLATHFHNWYHEAPIEEVKTYIEDLALWGYNSLMVWFDMHHFTGIDDPAAQAMLDRLASLLKLGQQVGMTSGIGVLANEGYKTTPEAMRAERVPWTGFYGCEICPSKPGGSELIVRQQAEEIDAFRSRGVNIGNLWLWPYDQGGCLCPDCSPWGANGFLRITKQLSTMIREKLPDTRLIMSTWLFDFEEQDKGEWRGLAEAFNNERPWVDCLLADSHTEYPSWPLKHPAPGGLPLLNFPEISMWRFHPWGGYGANPQPERFERLFREASGIIDGGFPYSEGIFEDFNKILYSRFYWDPETSADAAMREYVEYYFSRRYTEEIMKAIRIIEKNQGYKAYNWRRNPGLGKDVEIQVPDSGAAEAFDLIRKVDSHLPGTVKTGWRWRLLYLRAMLDVELRRSGGVITAEINAAMREIITLCHLEQADFSVRPPVVD